MQLINSNSIQKVRQVSTNTCNSHQDKPHVYTLEHLIQTLEEVAKHLTSR
ncbi:serine dehydratase [Anabaena sp. WFMT]